MRQLETGICFGVDFWSVLVLNFSSSRTLLNVEVCRQINALKMKGEKLHLR